MLDRERVHEVFAAAVGLPDAERAAFLDSACGGDAALRAEIESLLAASQSAPAFMSAPTATQAAGAERVGAQIGPYRLLEEIGEGGFGTVYMAEQTQPVRRTVALKIIKAGMDTRTVIARFEAERQALALMDHANIARVLDAGATESGRPYFVMELVKGEPITAYCDRNNLSIPDRLGLFVQVCYAVQHAHSKGVIHRDIKPTNILVATQDGRPHAKVIDFGIAKATQQRLTEKTLFTGFRTLVGTPEYMSPEQAEGSLDIDTRTDVYGLGVLLYELLTGSTPFDGRALRSAAYAEMQRIIREVEPPKPSTRLSQSGALTDVAAHRSTEPGRLSALVRGDLDWIVMKALDKDRARRYETPGELAAEIARYGAGEPVSAVPPSAAYRLRKLVRRHKGAVLAGALLAGAILAGLAGTTWGMVKAGLARDDAIAAQHIAVKQSEEAQAARTEAEKSQRIASAVTEFFTQDVLDARPVPAGQPEPTLRQMLDEVPGKIEDHFKDDPAVEGAIRERVGQLYRNLGDITKAESYLREAIPLLEQGLGPLARPTLAATHRLGQWMNDMGRYAEAAALFDKAYQGRLEAFGMDYSLTGNSLVNRGEARVRAGDHEGGLADIRAAWDHYNQHLGVNSRSSLFACSSMASALLVAGRPSEARDALIAELEIVDAHRGKLGAFEEMLREQLGSAYAGLGDYPRALEEIDRALALARAAYPESHIIIAEMRAQRGTSLRGLGRSAEARTEWEAAYPIAVASYGAQHEQPVEIARKLAELAEEEGDQAEAERWRSKLPPG